MSAQRRFDGGALALEVLAAGGPGAAMVGSGFGGASVLFLVIKSRYVRENS